jgi:hypothetical protein
MFKFNIHLAVIALLASLVVGCGSSEPLHFSSIQLGRSLNADNTVGNFTTTFKPGETVYVAVVTTGSGSAEISVRWTYSGRVVDEPKKKVSYKDVAATEFHLQTPAALPPGDYAVEVFIDGQSVGTRPFRVLKQD